SRAGAGAYTLGNTAKPYNRNTATSGAVRVQGDEHAAAYPRFGKPVSIRGDSSMMWFAAYVAAGAFVGVLAGLLGIGGGMTLVPVMAALFAAQQFAPDHVVHMALATCMASVIFTSSSSVREHLKFKGVDFDIVKRMTPGMVIGSLLATSFSAWIPQRMLALSFAVIVFCGATQILLNKKPEAARSLPSAGPLFAVGVVIGIIAGL